MRHIRTYSAAFLLILFCSYYAGISMFAHIHTSQGANIVHSHLGGGTTHEHSDSEYAVIDILSHFQSEDAVTFHATECPFFQLSESHTGYQEPSHPKEVHAVWALRGPPVA